jgi:UDP-3-O-[3-hydroxymyristoyl] glucosamine N-acyltransferase
MAAGVTICGHCYVSNRVSIGAGAVLRDNITVGEGATIAMGSVVVGDVGADQAVMGVPAKVRLDKL